ncbi:LuxR C-terminal-related transcriptional regulator, partial [Thermogutta sp.]|uniref:response regulator transcription factor n=1 Tax=Thermogutta sp. TaxID=1962930 RepID=UPI0025D487B8
LLLVPLAEGTTMAKKKTQAKKRPTAVRAKDLTPRERQVIRLISLGCSVKEAAAILKLAPSTVDNHKSNAMKKLGVNKLPLVTRMAIKLGISRLNDRLTPLEKRRSGRKNDGWN